MLVELGSFDVIIGMDWLTKYHTVIVCDEKIVRVPFGNEILIVHVFPEELPGIPPTRQVEFQIDLIPGVAPVARAPYQLAPFEMKELSDQLQELSDKGFIGPSDKQEAAFQLLKEKLGIAPILALLEGAENFIVYCNASHKGFGVVLIQNEKVIDYALCQLKIHEKNYTTHDLKLGAVVFALKIWRHCLYRTKCTMFTDHKILQHILDQKELNMRQHRCLELLSDYDCEIRYHPGKENIEARKPKNFKAEDVEGMIRKEKLELRADRTLNFGNGCDRHLPLIEFPYNNSYHTSIKATPFEKSYADVRRKPLEYQVGDRVMLKVSPWKGVIRFGKQGKLNPRYIGPFKVFTKVGTVAYILEIPQQLSRVYSTFHVSNLKKCLSDEPLVISLDEIHIDDKLHFVEEPIEIMNCEVKRFKQPYSHYQSSMEL
nr:putative reverse transcriptase domain-containing protein [Tanacetum cinerariifolium]